VCVIYSNIKKRESDKSRAESFILSER